MLYLSSVFNIRDQGRMQGFETVAAHVPRGRAPRVACSAASASG